MIGSFAVGQSMVDQSSNTRSHFESHASHLSLRVLRVQFGAPAQTQFGHLLVVGLARHVQRRVAALVVHVDRGAWCAKCTVHRVGMGWWGGEVRW